MKSLFLLLIPALLFVSCKKDSMEEFSDVVNNKEGVLRVECNSCTVSYTVAQKDYNVQVNDGSEDMKFQYLSDFKLQTKVASKENQNIRVMVIDSFGRVVSNELQSWSEGETRMNSFMIKTK